MAFLEENTSSTRVAIESMDGRRYRIKGGFPNLFLILVDKCDKCSMGTMKIAYTKLRKISPAKVHTANQDTVTGYASSRSSTTGKPRQKVNKRKKLLEDAANMKWTGLCVPLQELLEGNTVSAEHGLFYIKLIEQLCISIRRLRSATGKRGDLAFKLTDHVNSWKHSSLPIFLLFQLQKKRSILLMITVSRTIPSSFQFIIQLSRPTTTTKSTAQEQQRRISTRPPPNIVDCLIFL